MTSLNASLRLALINKAKSKKNILQKGFTLVELMVVIVIVGTLSAIALPSFLAQSDKAKATECTAKLGGLLSQVAQEAQTNSPTAGKALGDELVTDWNKQSDNCEFAMKALPTGAGADTVASATATGKTGGELAGKYFAEACQNWGTMRKDLAIDVQTSANDTLKTSFTGDDAVDCATKTS